MTKWIEWNEPMFTDEEPYCNTIRRMLPYDVVHYWERTHPNENYTDEEAIDSFMAVNWAWFKEYPDIV